MAETIGISISESYLQMALKAADSHEIKYRAYFLPKVPLGKALDDFVKHHDISEIEKIRLHLRSPKFILKKQLGTPPAVLVTAGFEDWLNMNLPIQQSHFDIQPNRIRSPLDRDLIFGVSERTSTNGNVDTPLDLEELEFLVSKLKMSSVENVALGFINSQKNSLNLNSAKSYLLENGFRVFTTEDGGEDEKSRWWNSILSGYLQPFYQEVLSEVFEKLPGEELAEKTVLATSSTPIRSDSPYPLSSLFCEPAALKDWAKEQVSVTSQLHYFGLEEFFTLNLDSAERTYWKSPFGNVEVSCPDVHWHKQQPTSLFQKNSWGALELSSLESGYEPGPMCLGRGLRPTFIDLIFLTGSLEKAPVLAEYINKKSIGRIKEAILSSTDSTLSEMTEKEILESTLQLALRKTFSELDTLRPQYFAGPLAEFFATRFRKLFPEIKFEILSSEMGLPILSDLKREAH